MKKIFFTSFLLLLASLSKGQTDYTKYVDPFIGTGGHGHTYPGATVPFGMVQLSPDTRIDGSWDGCSGYHYSDSIIFGFSHTHLSGTGCTDYGDILLMPMKGEASLDSKIYSSKFLHTDESSQAGCYSVLLKDDSTFVELTSTARVGMHRYTFSNAGKVSVVLDLLHRDKLLEGKIHRLNATTFEGLRRSEAWAKDQWVYYRIEFSKPVLDSYIERKNGNDEKAWFQFDLSSDEKLLVKVSLSSVSEEGAKKNMEAELPHWNFERVKKEAHDAWESELIKIEVSGGTEEQLKIFYTALYHTMIQPNIYNDVDGYYRGRDLKIHKAVGFNYYTVFSLWDTFRAWHPLMTIIDRKRSLDYIKTFLAQYEQGGLLPVWELSSNETECMIGYHAVSVITDAAMKGITDFNMEEAFEAMKKSAESRNRYGLGAYIDKGCLSIDDESSSVSKTLEYAYDDWCIAQMAKLLHHEQDYLNYKERSQSWENLYDPKTGFIRPRKNGGWYEPFDPFEVNNNYTEANAWQYTFFVPQEIETMSRLSGGPEQFEKKLDTLFSVKSTTNGREQADITGLIGQYAHGNEPSHHMAYLYNYTWSPWKTQDKVSRVLKEFYHAAPDGLIGNEDCGQMSAWYVMSAMGFYEVCPGSAEYALSSPLFSEIKIHQENEKIFSIKKINTGEESYYAGSFIINGRKSEIGFMKHSDILNGNELIFEMKKRSANESSTIKAGSFNNQSRADEIIPVPLITASSNTFKDNMSVSIESDEQRVKLFYTLDGSTPNLQSSIFNLQKPISIYATTTVKAIAVNDKGEKSKFSTAYFFKNPHPDRKIKLVSKYSPQYTAGGDEGIIDGVRGDADWAKGNWQGYQTDFECILDLGKEQKVGSMSVGFLQDVRSWILMPRKATFSFSTDGINFTDETMLRNSVRDSDYTVQVKDFKTILFRPINARYVKLKAENYGKLPEWHAGSGGQAWIFIDEISVQ